MGLTRKLVINVAIVAGLLYALSFWRTSKEETQYPGMLQNQ